MSLFKKGPFLSEFNGLCSSNSESFQEILLNFFKIILLCHSLRFGIFLRTLFIILRYFFSVNPSVRLYVEKTFFIEFMSVET